jgi:hypothetical protein
MTKHITGIFNGSKKTPFKPLNELMASKSVSNKSFVSRMVEIVEGHVLDTRDEKMGKV